MPELPDIVVYIEALERRILRHRLERVRLSGPYLLRTASPPIQELEGKRVQGLRRIGKRIAMGFDEDYWLVLHLMVAGRLHWRDRSPVAAGPQAKKLAARSRDVAAFDFDSGRLTLSEAGSRKRASTRAGSRFLSPASKSSRPASHPRTIRSSARSPIRIS